jgi:hypothetical protein
MRVHDVARRDVCRWIARCRGLAGAIDAGLLGRHQHQFHADGYGLLYSLTSSARSSLNSSLGVVFSFNTIHATPLLQRVSTLFSTLSHCSFNSSCVHAFFYLCVSVDLVPEACCGRLNTSQYTALSTALSVSLSLSTRVHRVYIVRRAQSSRWTEATRTAAAVSRCLLCLLWIITPMRRMKMP